MLLPTKRRVKTDKRDAENIARCLAYGTYSAVHVPTAQDGQVKEYIRMRDSMKRSLKATKQQILALVLRQGFRYNEGVSNWTQRHLAWLRMLKMEGAMQEALTEYLIQYDYMANKLERLDGRIEELANSDRYRENVKKLTCLTGIKTLTALTTIVEVGDFNRFARAQNFASFLGLVPGEHSSGDKQVRMGITKAGNIHLRRLLVEAAQSHTRGVIGHKSKVLKRRQAGNPPPLIAYADRANERLRRKFYRMTLQNQSKRNVAATAIARELACFIWGMMTDRIS
jgi:transposase